MKEYGDIPEDCKDLLQDGMIFKLDLAARKEKEEKDPMWASASSGPGDWFFTEDGS